jgi:sortase A
MKKTNKRGISRLFLWAGVALLVSGALVLGIWQLNIGFSTENMRSCVQTLESIIPAPQGAVPEERRDNTMSALSVDGTDFVGILEMPRFGSVLPVCGDWGRTTKHPCRLNGSVYDRTIQIGATSQKGQYDFYREISVGDSLYFTDMEGNRYAYTVTDLRYEKRVDQTVLQRKDAALTLFIKNVYGFEYIIVFCDVSG